MSDLQILSRIADSLDQDFEVAVRGLLALTRELTGMETAMILAIDYQALDLVQRTELADIDPQAVIEISEGTTFPWAVGGCRLLRSVGRNFSEDMQAEFPDFQLGRDIGLHAYVSVPIEVGANSHLVGTLCGMHPTPHHVDPAVLATIRVFARLIAGRYDHELQRAALTERAARAEQRLRQRLTAVAEHEQRLLTSLTVVGGYAQLALADVHPPDEQVGEGRVAAGYLRTLAERVEDLTGQVASVVDSVRQDVALESQAGVLDLARVGAQVAAGVSASVTGPVAGVWVNGDETVVRFALAQVLGTRPGPVTIRVEEPPRGPHGGAELASLLVEPFAPHEMAASLLPAVRSLVMGMGGVLELTSSGDAEGGHALALRLPTAAEPVRL